MADNRPWNMKSFLDSLIVELDKAQDTLALKGVNRPLTYTVKDVSMELQIFPTYTDKGILFSTAQPGQAGASKVSFQLGSITDRQIRETTKPPIGSDDISVDSIDGIDDDTKKALTSAGVRSAKDLEKMEEKNIDIRKATGSSVDYKNLASVINQAKRKSSQPSVDSFSLDRDRRGMVLSLTGANLAIGDRDPDFPIAMINQQPTKVVHASPQEIHLSLTGAELQPGANDLTIALDRYSIVRITLNA